MTIQEPAQIASVSNFASIAATKLKLGPQLIKLA